MKPFDKLADRETINRTILVLKKNGIDAVLAKNGEEARKKVFEMIPEGAEVMDMTSRTLDSIGIPEEIQKSGRFNSVRKAFSTMDQKKQGSEMRKLGAAPDFAIGSVHAVTEDGAVMVASATGSQLPAYAYGAGKVIWVVGAQKIVKDIDEGMKRIYEHSFPLEDARAKKVYGMGSNVSKILVIRKEFSQGRAAMIIVNEVLGF